MKRFLIISGLVLSASLAPVRAIAATFSKIVVYGDSLSDLGRAAAATSNLPPQFKFPAYPNGDGRFSNGPIWIEYLAAKLGIDTNPTTNPNFAATNFAIGGATTGTANIGQALSPSFIGTQTQVTNNLIKNPISDPNALYIVWAGANDYLGGVPIDPLNPVGQPLTNLSTEIALLISSGAKNILVPNLANLGELPVTLNTTNSGSLDGLTLAHNTGLAASILSLRQSNSGVNLNLLDVNSLFIDVVTNVSNPSKFGITNVTDRCITSCSISTNPSTYLFWDDIHPTTAGHKLIGDLAFNLVSPTAVPEPTSIIGSLVAFGSVVTLKRKLKSAKLTAKKLVEV